MPQVNPEILRWARETAGLELSEAAEKLKIGTARGLAPVERLQALEAGEVAPTRPLLVKMAKQYRRPLLTFYLNEPPVRGDRGEDFRTLPHDHSGRDEALLDALIRGVQARQGLVRSALLDEDDAQPLRFIGSRSMDDGVEAVLRTVRETLDISHQELGRSSDPDAAFQLLRRSAEEAGVFVLLLGNLGSHHTNIDVETFRGFALADDIAPFIVINDQDHRAAWSFTLIHEFVHLLLGQTGVSGGRPEQAVERFCNDVASEFLLPSAELADFDLGGAETADAVADAIDGFATARHLSRSLVAYRLYRSGSLSREAWMTLSRHFRDRWLEDRERRRLENRGRDGGPNFYVVRRHRLGPGFVQLTARLMNARAVTTSKAAQILGVKPKNVQALIGEYRVGAR